MKIDINEIRKLEARRQEINALDFDSIVWMEGDKEIQISKEKREEWRYIGLSNWGFVTMEFYAEQPAAE